MPAINRNPKGLLSILDGQTQGNNPKDLEPLVRGILDMSPLYYAARGWEVVSQAANQPLGSTGPWSAILTVPSGELWMVRAMGLAPTVGALVPGPQTQVFTPLFYPITSGVYTALGPAQAFQYDSTKFPQLGQLFGEPLVLTSGNGLGWNTGNAMIDIQSGLITAQIARFVA